MKIDLGVTWSALRARRDGFAASAAGKARSGAGDKLLIGRARFVEPTLLDVQTDDGQIRIKAKAVIIANGSRPVLPGWLEPVRSRVITTDELFELETLPASIGILGLGAIGLEMGLALSRLGVQVIGADLASTVAGIADPVIAERAIAHFANEMPLWLGAATSVAMAEGGVVLRAGVGGRRPSLPE